ncbi:MAG: alanine:cation symporter family protein [Pirellulales bacterium]|nr:alanine:cation symporter family protein [Pirellulales bacterium]
MELGLPDAAPATSGWMEQVDQAFGKWLVAPLEKVLFFDLRWFVPGSETDPKSRLPFVVIWLFVGAIYFTLRMNFINLRGFWHSVRLTRGDYDNHDDAGEVTHFQALASALSGTLGLGNIAGVAIGVGKGGPGAIFWLIVAGLFGMSSKFVECSLGQMYRQVDQDGTISGGPMHYLREGLAELGLRRLGSFLAAVFAVMCIGGAVGGGGAFQVGQSMGAVAAQVSLFDEDHYPWLYGLIMAVLVGIVIIGGIKRIAATAERIVPFMCALYMLGCFYILFVFAPDIPAAFVAIYEGAFHADALYGGFLGVMVVGVQRAAFSNEAGIGSASIAHAAARTKEPISEGIVALLEPFIDTVVVCTLTGLVIVVTGVYRDPALDHLVQGSKGSELTAAAFGRAAGWFPWIVTVSSFLFAYATLICWSYYGERCATTLFGAWASLPYKLLFLVFVVLGSIITATNILVFSDLMILAMGLPNVVGLVLLNRKVRRALDDYWQRYRAGEFEPRH